MSVTYQQEFLDTCKEDSKSLIEEHWKEIALNKDVIKLNPDWEAYKALEASGSLSIFTARDNGILVGYFVVITRDHIHYKDHRFASNDILYLSPEYRRGRIGLNLIKFAEECIKQDGISVLVINTKCHKPFDSLLEYLGFTHIENIYSKLLKG